MFQVSWGEPWTEKSNCLKDEELYVDDYFALGMLLVVDFVGNVVGLSVGDVWILLARGRTVRR